MKQLVIIGSVELGDYNAPSIHILTVAAELAKFGHEVTLIAPQPGGDMPVDVVSQGVIFDQTVDLTNWRLINSLNSLVQFSALWRNRKKRNLYIRSAPLSILLIFAAKIFGYRRLVVETNGWFRDEVEQIGYPQWLARLIGWFQIVEARQADKIRVVTTGLKDLFIASGIDANRIAVIGNGSSSDLFNRLDRAKCRDALNLKAKVPYFIFVGNLWAANDLPTMFKAIAVLRAQGLDAHCLVVGSGTCEAQFINAAKQAGIFDTCQFTGMVSPEQVNLYLNAADVAVLPSNVTYYGKVGRSPLKLGNYAATGKPVVATSLPGIDDLADEPWIFICPPRDVEAMASQLKVAYENSGEDLAEKASSFALKNYSWKKISSEISQLFE